MQSPQLIIDFISDWLSLRCDEAGMKGFTVGISGGIDSAVTSTLCARTGKPVFALNMPIYQNAAQISLADSHIQWLMNRFNNVRSSTIDLTSVLDAIGNVLPPGIQDQLTMANTRSRLRMITLYAFSTHHRLLVAGTGNKVEDFGVGFFTKYGDGGVDLSPIADLMKSEVREIGRYMGIIEPILDAKPTDGLWSDNRSDEDQIGATYDELEWAMRYQASGGAGAALNSRQQEVLSILQKFNRTNRHKMEPIPIARIPERLRFPEPEMASIGTTGVN